MLCAVRVFGALIIRSTTSLYFLLQIYQFITNPRIAYVVNVVPSCIIYSVVKKNKTKDIMKYKNETTTKNILIHLGFTLCFWRIIGALLLLK